MMSKAMQLSVCLWVLLVVGCWAQDDGRTEDGDAERPILPELPILPLCGAYWGSWSTWSACNVRCGKGTQTRRRECIRRLDNCPAQPGPDVARIPVPRNCTGPSSQTRTCVMPPCCPSIHGGWSKWGCWGECRNGFRQRHRVCNNPIPQGWGTYCQEKPTETDDCCALYQDIVFSLDASGSIGRTNFDEMVSTVYSVIWLMDLDTSSDPPDTVRVGIQLFNQGQIVKNHLNDFVLPIIPYNYPGGGTNIPAAITHANNVMFTTLNGDRPNPPNPNTLVLITDGWSSTQTPSTNNIDRILVIGVGNNINSAALQQYATSPDDFYHATNFCGMRNWLMQRLNCSSKFVIRPALPCFEITSTLARGRETDISNF